MNLAEALAQTDADKGPRSHLDKYLAEIEGTPEADAVLAELNGQRQAAHLGRALTLLARKRESIPGDATISGQSVTKWRTVHGS